MSDAQMLWERGCLDDQLLDRRHRLVVIQLLRERGYAVDVIKVGTGEAVAIKISPVLRVITSTGMRPSWKTYEVQRYQRKDGWDVIQPEIAGRGELTIMRSDPVDLAAAWCGFLAGLRAGMTAKTGRSATVETGESQ